MDGCDGDVRREFLKGLGNNARIDGFNPSDAGSRLYSDGREAGDAIASMGGDGLNVGSDARARGGVKAGDAQYD
jgi:hypothetical protein